MDTEFKERFLQNWSRYFPGAELPIGFYYSNSAEPKFMAKLPKGHRCIIGDIAKARKGKTVCFDNNTIGVLTFAVPWPKFVRMADNMKESFLITKSWNKVRTRIKKDG